MLYISQDESVLALKQVKNSKAPCEDRVNSELSKSRGIPVIEELQNLLISVVGELLSCGIGVLYLVLF